MNRTKQSISNDFVILFVHGYTASPSADFYPSLLPLLSESGVSYIIPSLPGGKHPHAAVWIDIIHEAIKDNKKPLIIVGHSLGTRTALLFIEKYLPRVEKLFLVAAFANRKENALRRGGEAYPDFFTHEINLKKILPLIKNSYVLHSRNDPSIPFEQGAEIARELGAELIVSKERKHFSAEKNAPYIFSVLKDKLGF